MHTVLKTNHVENQVKIILDKGNGYWLKTEEDIHI